MYIHRERDQFLAHLSSPVCPVAAAPSTTVSDASASTASAANAAEEAHGYVKQVRHAYAGIWLRRLTVVQGTGGGKREARAEGKKFNLNHDIVFCSVL